MSDSVVTHGATSSNFIASNAGDIAFDDPTSTIKLAKKSETHSFSYDLIASDFSFNANKTQIGGGQISQVDTRPSAATFYSKFDLTTSANWGNGSLVPTSVVGATIDNQKLKFHNTSGEISDFDGVGNASTAVQTGTIRLRVTPHYSGNPTSNQMFFSFTKADGDTANLTMIYHKTDGTIQLLLYGDTNHVVSLGSWSPVAETEYEFELNFDFSTGEQRVFIDGVQFGATQTFVLNRTNEIGLIRIGQGIGTKTFSPNFSIRDILIFDQVQHTADYTPDWSNIFPTIYLEDAITAPTKTNPNQYSISAYLSLIDSVSGSFTYTLNGLYWNGSSWVSSNGSKSQSNSKTDINSNLSSFPVSETLNIIIFTSNSNVNDTMSALSFDYQVQFYSTNSPYIYLQPPLKLITDDVEMIVASFNGASSNLSFVISVDGIDYYYNGSEWIKSSSDAESNHFGELTTEDFQKLLSVGSTNVNIKIYFHSDGHTTPEFYSVTISYSFFAGYFSDPTKCNVWGFIKDNENNPVADADVTAILNTPVIYANSFLIIPETVTTKTDASGYFELSLIETGSMTSKGTTLTPMWRISYLGEVEEKVIPSQSDANLFTLP